MKHLKIFLVIVLALGLAGGVFFWWVARVTAPALAPGPVPAERADAKPEDGQLSGRGRLADLLARTERLECEVRHEVANSLTEGTVFMSGGQLRGDFVVPIEATTTSVVSVSIKDQVLYVWAEVGGEQWGVKKSLSSTSDEVQLDAREPVSLEAPVLYNCKPWTAYDPSVFVPPADILFRDLADIQADGMEYGTTFAPVTTPGNGDPCATCALISEDGPREQCEIRFACGLQPN